MSAIAKLCRKLEKWEKANPYSTLVEPLFDKTKIDQMFGDDKIEIRSSIC